MNNIARNLFSAGLLLCATLAHGEFVMDQKFNGAKHNVGEVKSEEWKAVVEPFLKKWDKKILQGIAEDNDGITPSSATGGRDSAHIVWNGKHYYAWAVQYHSADQDKEIDKAISTKRKSVTLPGGGVCAVYVHDQDLNKLASLKIDLPENNHGTWCNGVYGLGGAGRSVDGVLVTLSYYLAGKTPAQRAQDIGKGWRYMTALIRFEEQDGKLMLKQDDSCLGNPNTYDTIPDSRKALSRCVAPKK